MLGKKKKEIIMSIERDGRTREFTSLEDASYQYQLPVEAVKKALETKLRVRNIWFRRRCDKNVSKSSLRRS